MTIEESRQSLNASVEYFSDDAPLVSGAAQCIVNMDALKTLLTAYEAQEADSKRLEGLMNLKAEEILQIRSTLIRSPLWDDPTTRFDAFRSSIDYCLGVFAVLSSTENTTP